MLLLRGIQSNDACSTIIAHTLLQKHAEHYTTFGDLQKGLYILLKKQQE